MTFVQSVLLPITIVFALGCGGEIEPPEAPSPDLGEAYPEVREFLTEKRQAVESNQQSASAWGKYAMALDAHEYGAAAETCYEAAVSLEPNAARWKYLLARRLESRQPKRAIELLAEVNTQGDADTAMLLKLASLYEQAGESESLEGVLKQLRKSSAGHPAVRYRLAVTAMAAGDAKLAHKLLDSIADSFRECARLQARVDAQLGRPSNSPEELNAAERLPSVQTTVIDAYAMDLQRFRRDPLWQGKVASEEAQAGSEESLRRLEVLVEKYPKLTDNRVLYVVQLSRRNRYGQAEGVLAEGLASTPENVKLLVGKATLQLLQSKWADAEETLRQVIALKANHSGAWADLAFALEQQQRKVEAIAAYEKAVALNPRDKELANRLVDLRGKE